MIKKVLAATTLLLAASLTFGCSAKNDTANTTITRPAADASQAAMTITATDYQAQAPAAATAQENPFNPGPAMASPEPNQEPLATAAMAEPQPASKAPALPPGAKVADSSQQFSVSNLPDVIMVNTNTIEKNTLSTQPLMEHLKITGLRVGADGKTVEFTVDNAFNRTNAKSIHTGGFMLMAQARYDYDNGAQLHNCVLLKDKRTVFQRGTNFFQTKPSTYPHVTKIENLQFFFIPTKSSKPAVASGTPGVPDTSLQFVTNKLPNLIVIDPNTIEQHSTQGKDPRLGYLKIRNLKMDSAGKILEFAIENTFDRQEAEPIHVGGIMITGMARYEYDNGAELHSCILFEQKHATLEQGLTKFSSDPSLYPGVKTVENLQFILTP